MTHFHKGLWAIMLATIVTEMARSTSKYGMVCVDFKMDGMSFGMSGILIKLKPLKKPHIIMRILAKILQSPG